MYRSSLFDCMLVLYRYTWRSYRDYQANVESSDTQNIQNVHFLGHFSVKLSKLFQITQFHLKKPVFWHKPPHCLRSLVYLNWLYWCICKLSHLLNYQNSFKILPNLGISLHQRVGAVLVDHLMTFWCPILREKTSWCLWCPDSCPDVHTKAWGPFGWKCPALMQMWEPRSAHVSRSLAWGTLDQDNTSCLVQGIPALMRTLTWCHWGPYYAVDHSRMHYF